MERGKKNKEGDFFFFFGDMNLLMSSWMLKAAKV